MLERIIHFSIRQRLFVLFATLGLIGLGIYSFQRLPIDALPDITNVQVQINSEAPGYSPLEVEQRITVCVDVQHGRHVPRRDLLLTDQMPFPMLDDRDVEDASRFLRPIRPPSIYNVRVDAGLESIVFRCLAASPSDRYADASDLLHDLERWTPGYTPPATSVSEPRPSTKSDVASQSPHDLHAEAQSALQDAIAAAKDPTNLMSAADMLEEALSKDPALRPRYEPQLKLWRKGIMSVSTADLRRLGGRPPDATGGGGA